MNSRKPRWLVKALGEMNVSEVPGVKDNPRILEYHEYTSLRATSDEVSWCSSFVCWCLEKSAIESTRSAAARSWLQWGVAIDKGIQGAIVVLARGPDQTRGHVGFYWCEDHDQIYLLGGNQSDKVCVRGYYKYNVLGYRVPHDDDWSGDDINSAIYSSDS